MGDPGGIGPEVIAKSLKDFKFSEECYYLLIGVSDVFEFLKEEQNLGLPLNPIPTLHRDFLREDSINFLDVAEEARWLLKNKGQNRRKAPPAKDAPEKLKGDFVFDIGKVSLTNAAMAFSALKVAAYQGATGLVDAVVTAPVHKTAIRLIDPRFHGHTEYLAKVARTKSFAMMFVSKRLKVTLVTMHVPLKKVSRLITQELIFEKIDLTDRFLKTYFKIVKPKIAVCALNPHGRETGTEEDEVIAPAVRQAQDGKIHAAGPFSADQIFYEAYEGHFDAVISMYHDQGLAPFKVIAFREGVNVTLGLPYIRTSPDHGTAFDIAYQGKADPASMKAALELATKLAVKSET
jgi:4-hydroxythreonine-4-phosphate dehydrogenase